MNQLLDNSIRIETAANPAHCILWLHGLGADGHDFEPIVPELDIPDASAVCFIFPHAPMRPVTINGGMRMRAWYDFLTLSPVRGEQYAQVQETVFNLHACLQELRKDYTKVIIGGFSQGGVVAGAAAISGELAPDGVFVLSAYLPDLHRAGLTIAQHTQDLPVFQAHGMHDQVIPIAYGRAARETFEETGVNIDYHEYPMEHNVCMEELRDLRTWLLRQLNN